LASLIRDRSAATAEMMDVFGDGALIRAALGFEAALARASGAEGCIPAEAAAAIAQACAEAEFDIADLAGAAAHAGTLAIPLVSRLRALVAARDGEAARFVHQGATSQDLADTALMLQAKAGAALIRREGEALTRALAVLAGRHAETPLLGRTLLQGALPITFGLRAAGWLLGVDAALRRFEREAAEALAIQLGGPVGALGGLGPAVAERVAADLGLAAPPLPWHARREAVAGLASALAILAGAVGKIARDVSLMAQNEVGEAFEPRLAGRGGSSAMSHKRNPTGCQVALSAAARVPGLAATILAGLPQEQERGLGGWQAEAPVLAGLFELTHGALAAMVPVIAGLEVDEGAMGDNLRAAGVGADSGHSADLVRRALAFHRRHR
jgi:3-carboxy-cis,cis-muconate cycloisomerase